MLASHGFAALVGEYANQGYPLFALFADGRGFEFPERSLDECRGIDSADCTAKLPGVFFTHIGKKAFPELFNAGVDELFRAEELVVIEQQHLPAGINTNWAACAVVTYNAEGGKAFTVSNGPIRWAAEGLPDWNWPDGLSETEERRRIAGQLSVFTRNHYRAIVSESAPYAFTSPTFNE